MPSGTKGSWKRALGAAYTRSQCSSMVEPMPMAGPPTAATTGLAITGKMSNSALAGVLPSVRGTLTKSATSLPAVKHSAVPCSSTARTWLSASASVSALPRSAYISGVMAFFLSTRSKRIRATRPASSLLIKTVILELLAQRQLRELAGGGMRQIFYEDHIIRHPPLGNLAFVEAQQIVFRHFLSGLLHHHEDRALVPLGMLHSDHRRLGHRRMFDRDVL